MIAAVLKNLRLILCLSVMTHQFKDQFIIRFNIRRKFLCKGHYYLNIGAQTGDRVLRDREQRLEMATTRCTRPNTQCNYTDRITSIIHCSDSGIIALAQGYINNHAISGETFCPNHAISKVVPNAISHCSIIIRLSVSVGIGSNLTLLGHRNHIAGRIFRVRIFLVRTEIDRDDHIFPNHIVGETACIIRNFRKQNRSCAVRRCNSTHSGAGSRMSLCANLLISPQPSNLIPMSVYTCGPIAHHSLVARNTTGIHNMKGSRIVPPVRIGRQLYLDIFAFLISTFAIRIFLCILRGNVKHTTARRAIYHVIGKGTLPLQAPDHKPPSDITAIMGIIIRAENHIIILALNQFNISTVILYVEPILHICAKFHTRSIVSGGSII